MRLPKSIIEPTTRVLLRDFARFCRSVGGETRSMKLENGFLVQCILPERRLVAVSLSRRDNVAGISIDVGVERVEDVLALSPRENIVVRMPRGGATTHISIDGSYVKYVAEANMIAITYRESGEGERIEIDLL